MRTIFRVPSARISSSGPPLSSRADTPFADSASGTTSRRRTSVLSNWPGSLSHLYPREAASRLTGICLFSTQDTCPICRAQLPLIGTKIIPNYALEEVVCRWAEATLDEDARKEWMSRKDGWLAYKLALEEETALAASRATAGRPASLFGGGGRGEASIGRRLAEYAPNFYDRPQGAAAAQRPMFDAVSRGLGERYRAVDDARIMAEAVRAAYADEVSPSLLGCLLAADGPMTQLPV